MHSVTLVAAYSTHETRSSANPGHLRHLIGLFRRSNSGDRSESGYSGSAAREYGKAALTTVGPKGCDRAQDDARIHEIASQIFKLVVCAFFVVFLSA